MKQILTIVFLLALAPLTHWREASGQAAATATQESSAPHADASLARHDFLYAGEAKTRSVFLVKNGQVAWTYEDPAGQGEISDAVMLSNGTILIAHQYAIKLIALDRSVLWNYDAPEGAEIHTAMPIGLEHVLYVQNSDPAIARVVNIKTGATALEFPLPVGNPKSVHGHFRHARLTPAGELAVAHMDLGEVRVYDAAGRELRKIAVPGVWGVTPLASGNLLVSGRQGVREIDPAGATVWEFKPADAPDHNLGSIQLAWRLPNGNTLINNWFNEWEGAVDLTDGGPVQAVEVTPDKKVVWTLRSWTNPNLGPSTTIQLLDPPTAPEKIAFGDIK